MPAPNLPAQKKGGMRKAAPTSARTELPILQAQEITLADGTRVPVKIPPGMPANQAQALLAYLEANPEAAKAALSQAQQLMKNPGLANAFMNMSANQTPENAEKFSFLAEDPDLVPVFEDVKANGPAAFEKYWNDEELMAKISAKMRSVQLQNQQQQGVEVVPRVPAEPSTLFDAAKTGNVEAAGRMIEEGVDVNAKNDKNVTALGIAVGFNRREMVQLLIEKGADIELTDAKGNTVLHYAAGYGRKEIAEVLIAAGAKMDVKNDAEQKPIDVAKLNREKQMVEFLRQAWQSRHDE